MLHTLEIRHNSLSKITPEIGGLTSLTKLDLSRNNLTILPKSIANLEKLAVLDLSENQWILPPPHVINKGISAVREHMKNVQNECDLLLSPTLENSDKEAKGSQSSMKK